MIRQTTVHIKDETLKKDKTMMNMKNIMNPVDKAPPNIVMSVLVNTAYVVRVMNIVIVANAAIITVSFV